MYKSNENNSFFGQPLLIFYKNEKKSILMPIIKRKINVNINNKTLDNYYDLISPYGYSGPIVNNPNDVLIKKFLSEFNKYCALNNYVSLFLRFNPILNNQIFFENDIQITKRNKIVGINLKENYDEIFNQFQKKKRQKIRKGIKQGIKIEIASNENQIKKFWEIYNTKMNEKNSKKEYFFPFNYFKKLLENLNENSILLIAKIGEKIIGGSIFIFKDNKMHYHLSASLNEFKKYNPITIIINEAVKFGKRKNCDILLLGGGNSKDENDTLYLFKKDFSTIFMRYYTANLIFNKEIYNTLINIKFKKNEFTNNNFFPLYRYEGKII
jgi:serine/alanine adding enzyme